MFLQRKSGFGGTRQPAGTQQHRNDENLSFEHRSQQAETAWKNAAGVLREK